MQEYYFLFALAFLWTLFASIQDLKQREVANWLNFSLIAFALAYRAFYSISTKNPKFFLLGLTGTILFIMLAYALYYGKAFAGGDAKLLMAYGAILPFTSFSNIIPLTLLFLFLLFSIGAIYSIIYSFFIISKNKKTFTKEFKNKTKKHKKMLVVSLTIFTLLILISFSIQLVIFFSLISGQLLNLMPTAMGFGLLLKWLMKLNIREKTQ